MIDRSSDVLAAIKDRRDFLLKNDYHFAAEVIRIKQKAGGEHKPFLMNVAQQWLHQQLELQLHQTGMVRAFIPKARQMGVSTYAAMRYYKKTSNNYGIRSLIMAHRDDSTAELFTMVKDMHGWAGSCSEVPELNFAPTLGATNRQELVFPNLKSGYRVSTAAAKEYGRGMNFQNIHGSEVAMWANESDLAGGLMQTLSDDPGTEAIFESTGRGPTGWFYSGVRTCMEEQNRGEFRAFFLPWSWYANYVRKCPANFRFPEDFVIYGETYRLTKDQLYWAYIKNQGIASKLGMMDFSFLFWLFRQEYPITIKECFQIPMDNTFFDASCVLRARARNLPPTRGAPTILGIDASGRGSDSTFMIDRTGAALGGKIYLEEKRILKDVELARNVLDLVIRHHVSYISVDCTGGYGDGLVENLERILPENVVVHRAVMSSSAHRPKEFNNLRAELHNKFRDFVHSDRAGGVSIPNDDVLYSEMMSYVNGAGECRFDDKGRLTMTPKEKIKLKLNGESPNRLDAAILTTEFDDADLIWRTTYE